MVKDDGNEKDYKRRLREYHQKQLELSRAGKPSDLDENYHEVCADFKITSWIWNRLYNYQKTGIRWLLKLHQQLVGGILADEMGLGKTIQVAVFLRILAESKQYSPIFNFNGLGPVLIVCPATLMHQWVKELNNWFPRCRAAVFHTSGSHNGSRKSLLRIMGDSNPNGSILITSYTTYANFHKDFQKINWHYVILDEGHKIRNPETKTTMALKELRTPHRLLLSGSPLQNNLKELWSLIDFVYPGRLGSLKDFTDRFSTPITQGGFANATKVQIRSAYKLAVLLRDAINPYMLQRMKKDVEMVLNLPDKSEQILFCDLTAHQRSLYKEYISSKEIKGILSGKTDAFVGLITLRKLCNHPDLVTGGPNRDNPNADSSTIEEEFGAPQRSGKLIVVQSLLKLWFKQNQKVLLFSQSRQMLTILEKLVIVMGYNYLRMDGSTTIGSRQSLVKRFNNDPDIFVFLLTTRVGGLGLNLTGANRVIIYDPDWNPSTDAQAKERAWRIGQNRAVTIYRLMTSGTIEEKIYQRQIFKQFLANRILVDPKQKRFFKTNDLYELFTLTDERVDKTHGTETAAIFSDKPVEINKKNFFDELAKKKKKLVKLKQIDEDDISDIEDVEITLTEEYKQELREKARLYAQLLAENDISVTTIEQIENSNENQSTSLAQTEKTKHKKRLLDGKFEIKYLRKQRNYKSPVTEEQKDKDQDDYVLKHLLKKAGVHSALNHDNIVNDSKESRADIQLIEDESDAIAKRAAEVLKRSYKQHCNFVEMACSSSNKKIFGRKKATHLLDTLSMDSSNQVSTITTPSKSDDEDDQLPSMFNGGMKKRDNDASIESTLSSSELANAIKRRRYEQLESIEVIEERADDIDPEIRNFPSLMPKKKKLNIALGDKYEKLADDIRKFFVNKGGRSTSNEVVSKFKSKVPAHDSFVFRSILRQLCFQLPNSHWALRDEFR